MSSLLTTTTCPSTSTRSTRAQKRKAKAERKRVRQLVSGGAIPKADRHILGINGHFSSNMTTSTMQMIVACTSEDKASEPRIVEENEEEDRRASVEAAGWELVEDEETADEWVHVGGPSRSSP